MNYYSFDETVISELLAVGVSNFGVVADKKLMTIKEDDGFLEFPLKNCRIADKENILYFFKFSSSYLKRLELKKIDMTTLAFEHPDRYRLNIPGFPDSWVKTDSNTRVTEKGRFTSLKYFNSDEVWTRIERIKDNIGK